MPHALCSCTREGTGCPIYGRAVGAHPGQSGTHKEVMVDYRHQVPSQLDIKLYVVCSLRGKRSFLVHLYHHHFARAHTVPPPYSAFSTLNLLSSENLDLLTTK